MAIQTTQLRDGSNEYCWSPPRSVAWAQKLQLHRDIQAERGNVKKTRERAWMMASQVFKHKNVGRLPVYLVTEFLAPAKLPISARYIEKSKNIENRVDNLHKVRHIFQEWNIRQDPNKEPIDVVHHYLSVVVENRLTLIHPVGIRRKGDAPRTISWYYDKPRTVAISMYSVSDLKKLCRLRYLKVGGNKNTLVERLASEKW